MRDNALMVLLAVGFFVATTLAVGFFLATTHQPAPSWGMINMDIPSYCTGYQIGPKEVRITCKVKP